MGLNRAQSGISVRRLCVKGPDVGLRAEDVM